MNNFKIEIENELRVSFVVETNEIMFHRKLSFENLRISNQNQTR